jgi:hypothetical protein
MATDTSTTASSWVSARGAIGAIVTAGENIASEMVDTATAIAVVVVMHADTTHADSGEIMPAAAETVDTLVSAGITGITDNTLTTRQTPAGA